MISTNLNIREDRFSTYRDPTGYMFAKWFDEPFITEVLNEQDFRGFKFIIASDSDDRKHIDLYATDGTTTYTIDCKIMTRNFEYDNGHPDKRCNKSYADVVTIADPCLNCATDYIMFVRQKEIILAPLKDIRDKVKPINIFSNSKGLGGVIQTLNNYRATDLRNLFTSIIIPINDSVKAELHIEAAKIYERTRDEVRSIQFTKTLDDKKKYERKLCVLEEFRKKTIEIINRYNSIYVELPKVECTDTLLSEVMNL